MRRDRWSAIDPHKFTRAMAVSNLVLVRVIRLVNGVDKHTLSNLYQLKNGLLEEFLTANGGHDRPTAEYIDNLERELAALAANHSEEMKAREAAEARERMFGSCQWFEPEGRCAA